MPHAELPRGQQRRPRLRKGLVSLQQTDRQLRRYRLLLLVSGAVVVRLDVALQHL
jgi:hypothetical protein